jgi:hypothetical protein
VARSEAKRISWMSQDNSVLHTRYGARLGADSLMVTRERATAPPPPLTLLVPSHSHALRTV